MRPILGPLSASLALVACCATLAQPPSATAKPVDVASTPPVVVATVPQSGDTQVDPDLAEIRIVFSKEMLDKGWSFINLSQESLPEFVGQPHYLPDKRTCVIGVKLQPGRAYAVMLNSEKHKNFQDTAHQGALPYLLVFETKRF